MATLLYKIQQTMNNATIVHKLLSASNLWTFLMKKY